MFPNNLNQMVVIVTIVLFVYFNNLFLQNCRTLKKCLNK